MGRVRRRVDPPFRKRLREKDIQDRNNRSHLHRFANWLNNWHLTRIMAALSSLTILLFVFSQYKQLEIWTEESNTRKEERTARAWQIVTTIAPGNSGKKWALQYLANVAHEKLSGVNVSRDLHGGRVYLGNVTLTHSVIDDANFEGAIAENSNFSHSNCESSDFSASELNGAYFVAANLGGANFSDANMLGAILSGADLEIFRLQTYQGRS